MKRFVIALTGLIILVANVQSASAHVLITDESKEVGAVLHIMPDDDPVAGEVSSLYLDIQSGVAVGSQSDAELYISSQESVARVDTEVYGSQITAKYVFPKQGVYEVKYIVKSSGRQYEFIHSQRVGRGLSGSSADKASPEWARAGLVFGLVGLVVLVIVAVSRRREILGYSKF